MREGCTIRFLQLLQATFLAGWWKDSDGGKTSFVKICKHFLPLMGITEGDIRKYLNKAYNRNNWHQFVEEIDRAAREYERKIHDK